MTNWQSALILQNGTLLDAIRVINATPFLIALVIDSQTRLLGTITDGDIRRAILSGASMETPVTRIMNPSPVTASTQDNRDKILRIIKKTSCNQIPILNEAGCVVNIKESTEYAKTLPVSTPVVLMAGGLGTRLRPLTENCPKPLLPIGNKPILEIILENFIDYNFKNFFISINYKGEMIESHFRNGADWDVNIEYIRENKRMGTAGALSLINQKFNEPVIVMNADLLTRVNFKQLLDFHKTSGEKATVCVREYDFQIPFGVVQVDNYRMTGLKEKPVHRLFVNAGIYVLDPSIIHMIPQDTFYDMPDLLSSMVNQNETPAVFPIHEYWIDIGQMGDFQRASREFCEENGNVENTFI